jgi:hypothetical protein
MELSGKLPPLPPTPPNFAQSVEELIGTPPLEFVVLQIIPSTRVAIKTPLGLMPVSGPPLGSGGGYGEF